jgi:hypothetical protein
VPTKHPPSRQVRGGTFGTLVTLHALTPAGFDRLARTHQGPMIEFTAQHTVAYADADHGLALPQEGVVAAVYGSPWGTTADPGSPYVMLVDPKRLTAGARAATDEMISEVGNCVVGKVEEQAIIWGRCSSSLEDFAPMHSATGERILAAAHSHDQSTSLGLHPVWVGDHLLEAVVTEAGLPIVSLPDTTDRTCYRGLMLALDPIYLELRQIRGRGLCGLSMEQAFSLDRIISRVGERLKRNLAEQRAFVLAGNYPEGVATTYAQLREADMDPGAALEAALKLCGDAS